MTDLIVGVHVGPHDAAAAVLSDYDVKAAVQLERLTRRKGDGGSAFPAASVAEALSIAGATHRDVDVVLISRCDFPFRYFTHFRGGRWIREQFRTHVQGKQDRWMPRETVRAGTPQAEAFFDVAAYRRDAGFGERTRIYFHNHHLAHALPALFYTDWEDALLVTADGGGDTVNYSHRHFAEGKLSTIYGGEDWMIRPPESDSLGQAYAAATRALGFRPHRHEGKLTGLAAVGQPVFAQEIGSHFRVADDGRIHSDFRDNAAMFTLLRRLAHGARREDVAASIQKVLEDRVLTSVRRLLERHPARHLGLAGGIFANVRLNRVLAEQLPLDEIFIFPPMGDEGLPVGAGLAYLLERDGLAPWLKQRRRLRDVYLGRDYSTTVDAALASTPGIQRSADPPIMGAARRLAGGEIGAIYTGRMEYGPRALGARSILANPARRETHDLLNERLDRTEFMPFAPVIAADKAKSVFDVSALNAYACRFMTITCDVHPAWREKIAAVVHVDNSARPQVIERDTNPLYFDILGAFEQATGIPVLVNTSFNVHEEPIVNAPAECRKALTDGRIDFVVTGNAIYQRGGPPA
jgi:carbamoyltransferase